MFALSAMFSSLTLSDAVTFAGWFELVFAWLQAIVVAAIALTVTRSHRVAAMSTLVWLVTNWIGQTYYSPQSLAYLLSLVMVLVILRQFALDGRLHARVTSVVGAIVRSKQSVDSPDVSLAWSTRRTIAIVLSLDVAIVVTHQLTPYIVALQVGVLTALGLRPRWLVVVCVALAVGYLLPNLDFVTSRYGLLSGLNPVENAQVDRVTYHRAWFYANVGGVLSYATLLLAALGGLRLARVGLAHRAIPVAALGLVPFAVIFGQSYGGEGVLRAFLFASPWLAILIAWGLSTLRPSVQFPAAVTMLASLSALFLFAFIGNAGSNVIPRDELDTSEYFYSTARPGSVLMLAGEDFPLRVGARYGEMAGPAGDHSPNLLEEPRFKNRRFVRRDLRPIARSILRYAPNGYLVFSTTQNRFARYYGTTPPGTFEELERWIADSPKFALWYSTPDSRIYRVRIRRCGFAHDCAASAARSRPGGTAP
jgi:hypothetical protein